MSTLRSVLPRDIQLRHLTKRTIMTFADRHGFVYFGRVDQHKDEHQLVRGLTLSSQHRDNHYVVGTFEGYDTALLQRTDTLRSPKKTSETHVWNIMQFDLHTNIELPHIFLGLHTQSQMFYSHVFTKFNTLQQTPLGTFGMHHEAFTSKYAIYTTPAESLAVERLFDTKITSLIGEHFGALTVEIADNSVYLYSSHKRVTKQLLETMLQNGIWLARHIDERAGQI